MVAIGFVACTSDETVAVNQNDTNEISFRPFVNGTTRAADISQMGLRDCGFTVFANVRNTNTNYFPETLFSWDGTSSSYISNTKYYWPSGDNGLDFFAYTNSKPADHASQVSHAALTKVFTVTPDASAEYQTDLLIGCVLGQYKNNCPNGVSINFRHAESMVTIKLKNSSTTTTVTVGTVTLGNVYTTGTYTFTGSTNNAEEPSTTTDTGTSNDGKYLKYDDWSGQATKGTYAQDPSSTSFTSATAVYQLYHDMILIPQTLTNANAYASESAGAVFNGAYISIPLKIQNKTNSAYIVGAESGENAYVTALWPLPATKWLPGYHYTYTVDLAGGGYYPTNQSTIGTGDALDPILSGAEIKFVDVTVDSWSDQTNIDVPPTN